MFGIPYNIIFGVHLAALGIAGCGILVADKLGFAWFRGKKQTLPKRTLHLLHEVMGGSLALLIASGLMLFWPMRDYLVVQPLFYLKMAFIAVLILNSFVIDRLMHLATHMPYRALPRRAKRVLMFSGALSFACWGGAGLAALLLFGL